MAESSAVVILRLLFMFINIWVIRNITYKNMKQIDAQITDE
jgi:hypothetical protein